MSLTPPDGCLRLSHLHFTHGFINTVHCCADGSFFGLFRFFAFLEKIMIIVSILQYEIFQKVGHFTGNDIQFTRTHSL